MNITEDISRSAITERAASWFVAHRAGALDELRRREFFSWLKESPVHIEEYLGIAALETSLSAATADSGLSLEALIASVRNEQSAQVIDLRSGQWIRGSQTPRRRVRRWWLGAASLAGVGMIAAVLVWAVGDGSWRGQSRSYETTHGGQGVWKLADGSLLHLNTDSKVTVRFSEHERLVTLRQGQALFEVAHETSRPFRVSAGDSSTIAVGTEFDVYRRGDDTQVTVVKGRVLVYPSAAGPAVADSMPEKPSMAVSAGQQVTVHAGSLPAAPATADLRGAVAWLNHQIVFEQQPLSELAGEFNRYNKVRFAINDPKLGSLPVSGVFDAYDTDSFATFLSSLDGVRIERQGSLIRVTNAAADQGGKRVQTR
jgi:transmembrane sensor